jgi:hypothetical protein
MTLACRRRSRCAGLLGLSLACGFDASGVGETDSETSSTTDESDGSGPTATSATPTTDSTTDPSESTSTDPATTEDPSSTGTEGETEGDPVIGCPDALPQDWIYCQDFEDLGDPFEQFEPYLADNGNFEVGVAQAFSGDRALRILYPQAGLQWSGEAWVRFGDAGNEGPRFAGEDTFDEVWVRLRLRLRDDWPGDGFGDLLSLDALEGPDHARVMSTTVSARVGDPGMFVHSRSCIVGNDLECDGDQDWLTDHFVAADIGSTSVTEAAEAPPWHCIVLHVRLNEPGSSDGFVSLTVDGVEDVVLYDLDLRGDWTQTGINALRILSSWGTGSFEGAERYLDDLVIASAPLACD